MFSRRPLNAKIHMIFSVFSGDQKYGVKKTIPGKSVLTLDFILAQVSQFTTSHHTYRHRREPSTGGHMTLWTTKHYQTLYEDFKVFAEVALHNISKWGCCQGWMSLYAVPNLRIHIWIYLVWMILFDWYYEYGVGKLIWKANICIMDHFSVHFCRLLQSKWWRHLVIRLHWKLFLEYKRGCVQYMLLC